MRFKARPQGNKWSDAIIVKKFALRPVRFQRHYAWLEFVYYVYHDWCRTHDRWDAYRIFSEKHEALTWALDNNKDILDGH
jgi:hypothetical protein